MNVLNKAALVGLAVVSTAVTAWFLLEDDEGPVQPVSGGSESELSAPATAPGTARPTPAISSSPVREIPVGTRHADALTEDNPIAAHTPRPEREPRSKAFHRAALANPENPKRWLEYAGAVDLDGRHDLALAALKRALGTSDNFEGIEEVRLIVKDYEEAVRMGRAPEIPIRILDGKGGVKRSRQRRFR